MDVQRQKRVLLVSCEGLGNGGVQAIIMGIVRSLYKEFQFDILLFTSEKRFYDDEFEKYGGRIYRIPRYEGKNKIRKKLDYYVRGGSLYHKVVRLLEENGPFDVIHCNDEYESAVLVKAAHKVGIPIRIVHTHIISSSQNCLASLVNSYRKIIIEKYATKKIGCSKEACNSFYLNKDTAELINNFYDDERFNTNNSIKSNKKEKHLQIIQIGMFSENKNQLFTLDLLAEIKKKIQNCKLVLVGFGDGAYRKKMEDKITELDLSENVDLYPSDADTPSLLLDSFAHICPSIKEGFGIVLIEAQAMGTRCYASNSIPHITNCGGVIYMNLNQGAKFWADKIILDYNECDKVGVEFDTSSYSKSNVMALYKKIYEGENV